MDYLVDSSAWIEYFAGSKEGEEVSKLLKKGEIFTLNLIISEVVSKIKRMGMDFNSAYRVILSNSKILDINPEIAREAGILHAEMKKNRENFGLVDAIIIISIRKIKANLITLDTHFKGFKEAVLIK